MTSWHLTRLRLTGACKVMLDLVEVTVAGQLLPRLQAAGSAQDVFPFLNELSQGLQEVLPHPTAPPRAPRPANELLPARAISYYSPTH
jgi:hypothetical protein